MSWSGSLYILSFLELCCILYLDICCIPELGKFSAIIFLSTIFDLYVLPFWESTATLIFLITSLKLPSLFFSIFFHFAPHWIDTTGLSLSSELPSSHSRSDLLLNHILKHSSIITVFNFVIYCFLNIFSLLMFSPTSAFMCFPDTCDKHFTEHVFSALR